MSARLVERLGRPHLWVALFSLVAVLTVGVVDLGRSSPGPLAGPHARVEGLAGPSDCAACHGGWFQDMSSACLDCHEAVAEHLATGRGLHGRLPEGERRCASCHSDHHGTEFAMVNALSFAKAGVPDVEAFDHGLVGFDMRGAHLELDCTECHAHAFDALVPEGVTRFMGLSQRCASCHEDPHEAAFGQRCDDCHTQGSFTEHVARGHDEHLPLVGGHAALSCRECHGEGQPHALEVVAGVGTRPPARACLDCHESPHGDAFAVGAARIARVDLAASCVVCHEHEHESFRDERLEVDARQHTASGFALDAPHDRADCASCHDPALATFEERYPGREADRCAACHEDPHGGQFDTGPFAAEGCVACHGRERFEPHAFDLELHARTGLPLLGSHRRVACEDCHQVEVEGEPRTFRGTANECEACHADAHDGFFDERAAALPPHEHGDCARCHRSTSFDAGDAARFDHGRWTGFPVGGAHAAEGCESCHVPSAEPDELGRRFGRVTPTHGELVDLHGGPEVGLSCAACHADPHGGRFDGPGSPSEHEGRVGCARCHTDASFRDLAHGFDHGLWTGFALTGAHARADCSACHAPLRVPDADGRTWAPAAGTACADCHADPHVGQFDRTGPDGSALTADCARCHANTNAFAKLRFDHDWDSRFPLDETHAALDCSACHRSESIGGVEAVRYKPLGTACTDCHGVRAGSLRKGGDGGR